MVLGAVVFIAGLGLSLHGKLPWLGRLPGDILVQRGPVTLYFPLGTGLVLSVLLTLAFWLFRR